MLTVARCERRVEGRAGTRISQVTCRGRSVTGEVDGGGRVVMEEEQGGGGLRTHWELRCGETTCVHSKAHLG